MHTGGGACCDIYHTCTCACILMRMYVQHVCQILCMSRHYDHGAYIMTCVGVIGMRMVIRILYLLCGVTPHSKYTGVPGMARYSEMSCWRSRSRSSCLICKFNCMCLVLVHALHVAHNALLITRIYDM